MLLGVDATKLTEHPILKFHLFSKILFNFPHVGGKMKIHLNRKLIQEFCIDAARLLNVSGQIFVTLCKGQGGTEIDTPRQWADTWQVVEMAAFGDLILTSVEHFDANLFPNYTPVGYRSADKGFHTQGALVHIFSKRYPLYSTFDVDSLSKQLEEFEIETEFGSVKCSRIHAHYYKQMPANSTSRYFYDDIKKFVATKVEIFELTGKNVPLHFPTINGENYITVNDTVFKFSLQTSVLDVFDKIVDNFIINKESCVLYHGAVFNQLSDNFSLSPISNEIILFGNGVDEIFELYLQYIINKFKSQYKLIFSHVEETSSPIKPNYYNLQITRSLCLSSNNIEDKVTVAKEYAVRGNYKFFVLYSDILMEKFFKFTSWRQLHSQNTNITLCDGVPILKLCSMYTRPYEVDISFVISPIYTEAKFYKVLWQLAGEIITSVKLLSTYNSSKGWKSLCFRITYQSFETPLNRNKAITFHKNVIEIMLVKELGVTVM